VDGADTVVIRRVPSKSSKPPERAGQDPQRPVDDDRARRGGSVAGEFDNVYVNGALYDDFNGAPFSGPRLDPSSGRGPARTGAGERRRPAGRQGSRRGNRRDQYVERHRFVNQNAVTALRADVTVSELQSTGSFAQARLVGAFYNDGTGSPSTGMTGDVLAFNRLFSQNGSTPHVNFW